MARTVVALLAALAGTGCATITRGTIEALVIETDPAGATASVSDGLQCTTPCALLVKRSGEVVVTVDKAGYETARTTVVSGVEGAGAMGMAGNYLLGPVGRSAERETSTVGPGAQAGKWALSPVPAESAGTEPPMEEGCR